MEERLTQRVEIERLFSKIRNYRNSENFREMLNFCAHFKNLAPYNAWMAQLQMPGARYILSEKEWKERYNRLLYSHARPIIILVPFGPISMVFDIGDTYAKPDYDFWGHDKSRTEQDILNELEAPYATRGTISRETLNHLLDNLAYSGIAIKSFVAAPEFGEEIRLSHEEKITFNISGKELIKDCDYLISINSKAKTGELFASTCHELGHLFCHHLLEPYRKWQPRLLSHAQEEFEAETVSWLICERMGVENPSEHYLARFTAEDGTVPEVSVNHILLAVNEIEHMIKDTPGQALERGLLWKNCPKFKDTIKSMKKRVC